VLSEELKAGFFEALDRENGSVSAAARAVGVSVSTAFGWARKAGVGGRGKTGTTGHPGRAEYDRLRAAGVRRWDAAMRAGVHERTARDWDRGIRKIGDARLHPDGRRIDYKTGVSTVVSATSVSVAAVEAGLHPRFLTVTERELIADLRRRSPRTARCATMSPRSCGSGGHPSRSATLWSSSSPTTRTCG
jgi:transposase, IS30 family